MSKENQEIEEIVEVEVETCEEVEEKKTPKGVIVAGVVAAGVGIAGGIAWLLNKLKTSRLDYVEVGDNDEDYFEEEDTLEIEISED